MEAKQAPVRIGDKFKHGAFVLEVVGTKPGGKVELFDKTNCRFLDTWHKQVSQWERIKEQG